jgi:uncharacterized protein (UPF0303 family)
MSKSPGDPAPTIDRLEAQERDLVLPRGDLMALHELGRRMATDGIEKSLPIVIQIRSDGRLVYAAALNGSTATNDEWASRKARVAQRFGLSSLLVKLNHERDDVDFNHIHGLPREEFLAYGGAIPLRVSGVGQIGTVAVSGLPDVDDHDFVAQHLDSFRLEG